MSSAKSAHRNTQLEEQGDTVPDALLKAGGWGRYQCLLLLVLILANNGAGTITYGVSYNELEPPYICTFNEPQFAGHEPTINEAKDAVLSSMGAGENTATYVMSCDTKTVCGTGPDQNTALVSYSIDRDSMFYVENWVEQLNMQCLEGKYIGLIGSFYFAGVALSCIMIPRLGDKYGRKTVMTTTLLITLALYPAANLTSNIGVIYAMYFYLGMGTIGRYSVAFVLLTESVPKKHQMIAGSVLAMGDNVATLYDTFFLRYIGNDFKTIIWIGFAFNIIGCLLSFFIVESPQWLVSVGRKDEALKGIKYIAKLNGAAQFEVSGLRDQKFETLEPEKKKSETGEAVLANDEESTILLDKVDSSATKA